MEGVAGGGAGAADIEETDIAVFLCEGRRASCARRRVRRSKYEGHVRRG
jgi:hypothetical protein